jgi:hypothetical protein
MNKRIPDRPQKNQKNFHRYLIFLFKKTTKTSKMILLGFWKFARRFVLLLMDKRIIILVILSLVVGCFYYIIQEIKKSSFHVIYRAPFTISEPGYYRIITNLESSTHGIFVESDDVTIDFGGFQITNVNENKEVAEDTGLLINNRQNITVRNGTIDGFYYGIQINNGKDNGSNIFEDLKIRNSSHIAIRAITKNSIIRNNIISQTYGSGKEYTYGIYVEGPGVIIQQNSIFGTYPSPGRSEAVGISMTNTGRGSVVESNIITNSKDLESGRTFGIWIGGNDDDNTAVALINNRVTNMVVGIAASPTSSGVYRDNTILSSEINYFIGTPNMKNGGNNFGNGLSGSNASGFNNGKLPDYK